MPPMPISRPLQSLSRALRRDAPAWVAFALVIVAAPQLLGGIYPWGMLLLAGASLGALGLPLWSEPQRGIRWTPLLIAMLLALLWTMIQALPLPCTLIAHVAPVAADELRRGYRMLGWGQPAWCTLSEAPAGTNEEIVKGLGVTAAFVCASVLARRGHSHSIYRTIAASGVLLALVAWAHAAVGATRVFGVYEPIDLQKQTFLSPIMNLNTLGGFLAMCLPILISFTFSETANARQRLLLQVCTGLVACSIVMTRSRGAVGALVLGVALLMLFARLHRKTLAARRAPRPRHGWLAVALAIAAALAVVAYGGYADMLREFRGGGWDKLQLIGAVWRFALRAPWVGIGRGAFSEAFVVVHGTENRFEYAENFPAQWATEWGFPISALLLAALVFTVVQAIRRARSFERMGALAGLIALAAQNLVDIGFEILGVSIVAAALLGAATANAAPGREAKRARRVRAWLPLAAVAGGLVLLLVLARPVYLGHGVYLRQQLTNRLQAHDRKGFRSTLARAVLGHPSEPVFAVLAASEALQHRDKTTGRWINRALQLAPGWPGPHLQAAQWLWNTGHRDQALLELGQAMQRNPYEVRGLLCLMANAAPFGVVRVIPRDTNRRLLFEFVVECLHSQPDIAAQVDRTLLTDFPDDARATLRNGDRQLTNGNAQGAADAADAVMRSDPGLTIEAVVLQARALRLLGRLEGAVAALQRAEKGAPNATALVVQEAELQAERGDEAGMRAALTRLHGLSASSAAGTASAFMLEASLERKLGNRGGALAAYDRAYGITGEPSALGGIASTAEELGDRQRAAWAYGLLCDLNAPGSNACAQRDRLKSRIRAERPSKAAQPNQK
jgi:tetratricopeptide (TPR) repeat protein